MLSSRKFNDADRLRETAGLFICNGKYIDTVAEKIIYSSGMLVVSVSAAMLVPNTS
jgi:hypothetical protein